MRKKKGKQNSKLRVGEIIRIKSQFGVPPAGIYRVDDVTGNMIMLSAGEVCAGVSVDFIEITERNLAQPASWESREIEILESSACDCPECLRLLEHKRKQTAGVNAVH